MSRIGILPVDLPTGIDFKSDEKSITVSGANGSLTQKAFKGISVEVKDNKIHVSRSDETKDTRAKHGLVRSLINNMVTGVNTPYVIKLELVGVGYRAIVKGQILELNLGFSHPIYLEIAPEVKAEAVAEKRQNSIITLTSIDKQLIGQVAAKIRSFRKPEPYKGKGVKFVGEELRRKAGKTAGAK